MNPLVGQSLGGLFFSLCPTLCLFYCFCEYFVPFFRAQLFNKPNIHPIILDHHSIQFSFLSTNSLWNKGPLRFFCRPFKAQRYLSVSITVIKHHDRSGRSDLVQLITVTTPRSVTYRSQDRKSSQEPASRVWSIIKRLHTGLFLWLHSTDFLYHTELPVCGVTTQFRIGYFLCRVLSKALTHNQSYTSVKAISSSSDDPYWDDYFIWQFTLKTTIIKGFLLLYF